MLLENHTHMSEYLQFFYHHIELSIAFVVILLLILWEELGSKRFSQSSIPPEKAVDLMNHTGAAVLDIRAQDAFKTGHIAGAMNMPANTVESQLKKLNKYKQMPVIIVTDKERESTRILAILKNKGFQQPLILSGGLASWRKAGLPLSNRSK